ncbi:MAG: (Fe-S)-binding protein [Candidatus Berkiella sp.]
MTSLIPEQEHAKLVDKLASQCVKCALCLPHCPTYELTKDENESPRGRIALFQALSQQKLPLTQKAKSHLDKCLGCRACERVCPAHVEYGDLLTLGRALLPELPSKGQLTAPRLSTRFLSWLLIRRTPNRAFQWLLWLTQISGLRTVARTLKITKLLGISDLESRLKDVPKPLDLSPFYPAIGEKRASVMLFTGCLGSLCEQETLKASIYVLRHLGMDVHIPVNQTCCGAMHSHAGDLQTSHRLAKENVAAFLQQPVDFIVSTATGCTSVLQEYAKHFSFAPNLNDENFSLFSSKVIDILTFVQQSPWPSSLSLAPIQKQVVLHTPCTRRNVLKSESAPQSLLSKIPGLSWQPLSSSNCCGAAGTYMLEQPQIAQKLAQQLLKDLETNQVNLIATSNIGCALHLLQQAQRINPKVAVIHPIVLVAQSLGF